MLGEWGTLDVFVLVVQSVILASLGYFLCLVIRFWRVLDIELSEMRQPVLEPTGTTAAGTRPGKQQESGRSAGKIQGSEAQPRLVNTGTVCSYNSGKIRAGGLR
jgi:hypothetical protein